MSDDVLWQSFKNATAIGVEAQALLEDIEKLLELGSLTTHIVDIEKSYSDEIKSVDAWVQHYMMWGYPLLVNGSRKKLTGSLHFAVSLWREEDEAEGDWQGAKVAKLYVAFAERKKEWESDSLFVNAAGRSPYAEPSSPYLWKAADGGWLFCVRLHDLQNRQDLQREVFGPLNKLLSGADDRAAFEGCKATIPPPPATPA